MIRRRVRAVALSLAISSACVIAGNLAPIVLATPGWERASGTLVGEPKLSSCVVQRHGKSGPFDPKPERKRSGGALELPHYELCHLAARVRIGSNVVRLTGQVRQDAHPTAKHESTPFDALVDGAHVRMWLSPDAAVASTKRPIRGRYVDDALFALAFLVPLGAVVRFVAAQKRRPVRARHPRRWESTRARRAISFLLIVVVVPLGYGALAIGSSAVKHHAHPSKLEPRPPDIR